MEKTESPSNARLEELREQGLVPISRFSVQGAMLLAFFFAASTQYTTLLRMLGAFREVLADIQPIAALTRLAPTLMQSLITIVAVPTICALSAGFLATLLQTRFLFRPSAWSDRFGSADSRRARSPRISFGVRMLGAAIRIMAGLSAGALVTYFLFAPTLVLFNGDVARLRAWPHTALFAIVPVVLIVVALGCLLSWLLARVTFMRRHRMTRREAQGESMG